MVCLIRTWVAYVLHISSILYIHSLLYPYLQPSQISDLERTCVSGKLLVPMHVTTLCRSLQLKLYIVYTAYVKPLWHVITSTCGGILVMLYINNFTDIYKWLHLCNIINLYTPYL